MATRRRSVETLYDKPLSKAKQEVGTDVVVVVCFGY